ncbi:MAG: response regulator transcription factor [Ectothiorhodospiraceae bacterium]|nr:response regulator transcription factor [Ectothiorhodospiraceae bacterium]MCH8505523.1 response regulator transcription factor [Ectothiorhodospiraceae bacterium]
MKIGIVDDHGLFREGMRYVLEGLGGEVQVLEAASGVEALQMLEQHPDMAVLLLDLKLRGEHGFTLLQTLKERDAGLPVIVMSASEDRADIERVLHAGARGFIPKNSSAVLAVNAIQLVLAGGVYLPPDMLAPASGGGEVARLTPRQRDVLALLAEGRSNKQIADRLQLAEPTVKMHVTAVIRALGARNRTEAVTRALQVGLASIAPAP